MPYHTSDSIFNLTIQPKRMMIFGGGPIGAELGQAFQRLGTQVTFILRGDRFLPKEDRDIADILQQQLVADGCQFRFNTRAEHIKLSAHAANSENKLNTITMTMAGSNELIECDTVFFATGRKPNVVGMGLEEAGVDFSVADGIYANQFL